MSDWQIKKLGDMVQLNYGKGLPLKSRIDGHIPVYGSNGTVGFHNEAIVDVAGIIIGRKGSAGKVHWSRVPFCPIDTTFYITQDDSPYIDLEFLFYLLQHINLTRIVGDVGVPGLNREMAYMEKIRFPTKLHEQKEIAHVLSMVQQAIEQQEKIIQTTTEMMKTLMNKLFTEGLRGEPQKQTEIGPIPESWEDVPFEKLATLQRGKDLTRAQFRDGLVPVAGSNGVIGFHDTAISKAPGVTVGRSGSAGKVTVYDRDFWPHNTTLYVRDFHGNNPHFVGYYLKFLDLSRFKTGASVPTLDRNSFKTLPVIVPSLMEQEHIVEVLDSVGNKIEIVERKKTQLQSLFRTLLHELMTAKRRVDDLEFQQVNENIMS